MSERVLHEWTNAAGNKFRLIDGPRPAGMGFERAAAETDWEYRPVTLMTNDAAKALLSLLWDMRRASALYDQEAARVSELETENAKLRKCVEKGDDYIDSIYSITSNTGLLHAEWSEKIDYYAARAEVDK